MTMKLRLSAMLLISSLLQRSTLAWNSYVSPGLKLRIATRLSSSSASDAAPEVKIPRKFVPFPFDYHEELTLQVSALTNLGMGICRTPVAVQSEDGEDDSSGGETSEWVIFVPNVIPGETVKVRVFRNHKNYSDADLMEVLEKSEDRVEPVCSLSEICGGCQYQHLAIDSQRVWKTKQVEELLEKIGGLSGIAVTPTLGTSETLNYRSKITPHYSAPKKVGPDSYEIGSIGFKQRTSRQLIDVPHCHIATEAINERLVDLREAKREEALAGQLRRPKRGATLLLRDADEGVITDHNTYVTSTVKGLQFRFLAGNFFQNNPYMLPVMVDHVVDAAIKKAGDTEMTHLIDCYCGSGLFCLSLSAHLQKCVGIEVNEKAIVEAQENAALNDITNCAFVAASAEAIFDSDEEVFGQLVKEFPKESTVVVCDPPRKGCSEEFLEQLYQFAPQRVVYMSCDPATQARDAKGIVEAGYSIMSVQPFDLFPQTRHIECLIVFEKEAA